MLKNTWNNRNEAGYKEYDDKTILKQAKEQLRTGYLNTLEARTFETLRKIHKYLFDEIYEFVGNLRKVNI